jgi:RecA/RadA recombinase
MSKENIADLLLSLKKQFGAEAIMRLGDKNNIEVESVSSGSLSLDVALGIGGYPRGRIIEIYGPESSGKTTLALHAIASVQKSGGNVAFIDAEHALDPVYARELGVDIANLLVSQPDNGEQALDICDALVKSGTIDLIVVDSVAALVPEAELNGDMGDSHIGIQARLMSQAMRKMSGAISKTKTIVIFINQLREKVGVMFGCFPYDQLVRVEGGDEIPIGKIVEDKLDVKLLCYNHNKGLMVARNITNYFDNGPTTDFVKITYDDKKEMIVTPNHLIATVDGYNAAVDLVESDEVYYVNDKGVLKTKYIESIEKVSINDRRYNLEVDEFHNYLVGGVVVHNSPEITTGGRALKFFASVRIDIRKVEVIKDGNTFLGHKANIKVVKNKVAAPFKVATVDIFYGKGISKESELIELGIECGVIVRGGSWFSYKGEKIGQGKDNVRTYLQSNPEISASIEKEIKDKLLSNEVIVNPPQ